MAAVPSTSMRSRCIIKLQDPETMSFLELYSGERTLYDPGMDDYTDRNKRHAALERISEALSIPGFGPKEISSKFKNLRSAYCQELKKITESERSGAATDEVYKPKVFWFDLMNSFLRPFVQPRRPLYQLEEHEESDSHNSNSKLPSGSSESEEQGSEEPQEKPLLPWNVEGPQQTFSLASLSNGAVGTRTGGAPLQVGTLRKKLQRFSQDPCHLAISNVHSQADPLRSARKYSCKRCNSVDIEPIGDPSTPGSKRKRDEGSKYVCKACGSFQMAKRVASKSTPSPKKSLTFTPSSDSESDVECLEEKKPKIKREAPSPKPKSSVVLSQSSSPDFIDHFGKYVTSLMRTVSTRRACRLQKDIISLLLEDKMHGSDQSD